MKKILIIIISILISFRSYSQKIDSVNRINTDSIEKELPSYYIVNGDTVGIILSIKQAQRVDNDEELLSLFGEMKMDCDSVVKHYVVVLNEYKRQVGILDIKVNTLNGINMDQSKMINNLKQQILNYQTDIKKAETQMILKDNIIKNYQGEIKLLNRWKYGGIAGTSVLICGFLIHSIIHK